MSLNNTEETAGAWPRLREGYASDFRHFRFGWRGFFRWTVIVLLAVLLAALITLYFLDWNQLRGPIGRYASAKSGREVRIDGDLKVDLFRLQPHISVGGLYVGNPAWLTSGGAGQPARPKGASVQQADVEFRLFPALVGDLQLPLLKFDHSEILVVRRPDGRTNWESDKPVTDTSESSWHLPPINRLIVTDGHVEVDDKIRKLKFLGTISSEEDAGGVNERGNKSDSGHKSGFTLTGNGTLNGNKFVADVHGGPLINVDETQPYDFNASISAGDTRASIQGSIAHPFKLDNFTAHAVFSGANLSELYYVTGLALPGTPPYKISGALKRDGNFYTFTEVQGRVGGSDVNGFLTVDVAGKIPDLKGHLTSRTLDFNDLGALFRGGKSPQADPYLLPDVTLHTEKLRELNAEVDYDADSINSQDIPLRGLSTHISVENSVLTLKPLTFSFPVGKLSGSVGIDARRDVPTTSIDARITDIRIANFIKGDDKPVEGTVEARAQLSGTGTSVHKAASVANGTLTAVIPSGQIRQTLAQWLGVNLFNALGLTLSGDNSNTNIRCAVLHFEAKDGTLNAQQFVFDTDPVRVDGQGTINLRDEKLDLRLQGAPKHFQFVRLHAPITVSGPLVKPAIGVDVKPLVVQGAIGVGLSLINPVAGILAFVDPGMAKNANCAGILTTAKAQGAPIKQAAVNKATVNQKSK